MQPPDLIVMVYRDQDLPPETLTAALNQAGQVHAAAAARAGMAWRIIPVSAIVPAATGQPRLWVDGHDLLEQPGSALVGVQVDDFSNDPQTDQALAAIRATVAAAPGAVLLNHPDHLPHQLVTDKLSIAHHAQALGIPAIPTLALPAGRHARGALPQIRACLGHGPYLLKPRRLGMGYGIVRAADPAELSGALDVIGATGIGYVAQPCLPNDGDLRLFLTDGDVLYPQHRRGGLVANTHQGGTSTTGDPALVRELAAAARQVADSLRSPLLHTDWLITADGPVLTEWSTGLGGFSPVPEPHRTIIGDAQFGWIRRRLDALRDTCTVRTQPASPR
ncbi:ATP-grasp domain-containing protein [Actinomadura harenae]|uniref:ATP-grasp domain-containing protein n=1 Tax=Actinomadura harenae TaxID=2483351 RepID=A0A3M2LYS8_9ACTN|nr:hypothetical protein [Actinomadura harenae]RMI42090.1 hypothetical protein EBO15_20785 [Actinomadura harenae]